MSVRYTYLIAIAATLGCATTTSGTAGARRNSNLITEQEIAALNVSNVYDAVSQLRPNFLRSRGRTTIVGTASEFASVYVNGQLYGDISSLRNIVASQVHEIRYYSASEAATQFGMQNGNGVIELVLK